METDMVLDMVIGTGILSDLEIKELCEKEKND
jgi:hypothetical protein